jgi:guanylate kinase
MRPGETNGSDYIFVTPEMFASMRDRGDFLEWAEVFGNLYGTPASGVNAALAADKDVVFDIDWQGARAVREALPGVAVSVFILPPSREELVRRIRGRASEPEDVIQRRLAGAAEEISHWDEYDYVLVNRDVDESVRALHSILAAERLKRSRQPALGELVRGLQQRS